MRIILLFIAMVLLLIWIGAILLDNFLYYRRLIKAELRKKKLDAAKKKKLLELKWPENLPHFDIHL